MKTASSEFQSMSPELRDEIINAVRNGDDLFTPSSAVVREAVQFVRPRSNSLIFIRLLRGPKAGLEGDGKLNGIGISPQLIEHVRTLQDN